LTDDVKVKSWRRKRNANIYYSTRNKIFGFCSEKV